MQAYPGERAAFDGDKIWQADAFMHKHAGDMPLPELLAMACGQLAKSDYAFAISLVMPLRQHPSRTIQQLIGTFWLHGPDTVANHAIQWLIEDPRRFCLGHLGGLRERSLGRALLTQFSNQCSDDVYWQLETKLLSYFPPVEREHFQFRLRSHGMYPSRANDFGFLQHHLLPALPVRRRSPVVVNAIGQLLEKFKRAAEEIDEDMEPKGGLVTSPIAPRRTALSDQAWLRLITVNWN